MSIKKSVHPEQGSITLVFCLVALLIAGAMSTSMYLGHQVKKKVELQNANDSAALAMSSHVAQGLNMISANNLAIAASLHIAGSFTILSAYLSFAYIFTADGSSAVGELGRMAASSLGSAINMQLDFSDKFQKKVWNQIAILPATFVQAATGVTKLNGFLQEYWMAPTPLYGTEILRSNIPGALGLSFQGGGGLKPMTMSYAGMRQTSPKETFCRTIKSSRNLETRDSLGKWLTGPILASIGDQTAVARIIQFMTSLSAYLDTSTPIKLGFIKCGYGLKTSMSAYLDTLQDLVLGAAGDLGLATGGFAQGTLAEIPSVSSMMDSIRENTGTHRESTPTGRKRRWTNPSCKISWGISQSRGEAAKVDEVFRQVKKYAKRPMIYAAIAEFRKNKDSISCENEEGELLGHIPIPNPDGSEICLNVEKIDPRCAYAKYVMSGNSGNCLKIKNKLKAWNGAGCDGFRTFMNSAEYPASPDFGITIADWGKQADTFAKARGVFSYRDSDLSKVLGFLVPDKKDEGQPFLDSLSILSIGASPSRFSDAAKPLECPEEFKMTDPEGRVICRAEINTVLTQMGPINDSSSSGDFDARMNQASGGARALLAAAHASQNGHRKSLRSTWARTQWVTSYAHTNYYPSAGDPKPSLENQLFWPAWQARLGRLGPDLLREALPAVGGDAWMAY